MKRSLAVILYRGRCAVPIFLRETAISIVFTCIEETEDMDLAEVYDESICMSAGSLRYIGSICFAEYNNWAFELSMASPAITFSLVLTTYREQAFRGKAT